MRAFIFPGQGSQAVGMGKALADAFAPARAVFEEVGGALGERLSAIASAWAASLSMTSALIGGAALAMGVVCFFVAMGRSYGWGRRP